MDNETTRCKMPSNSIERIVIFISDIFEKMMLIDDPPFIIKNNQITKQDLFVKIKESVDISIIDDKVRRLNDDFAKLFTIKNNYPQLLLKINRILLIFGEEKITKIYELVKYIANIETSKINNIQLISKEKISNIKYSGNSNTNQTLEEYKDFEKIKSFKNKDFYKTINYSNITNISEIQRKHNCLRKSATKSQNSCDSYATKESSAFPEMLNIKCIKEKNVDHRRFDSNSKMNSKEKNLGMVEIKENKFSNENKVKLINNAPIMQNDNFNWNNDKGNFKNNEHNTNNKFPEKELFSRDKVKYYNEIENLRNISEGKAKNGEPKDLRVSEKYKNLISEQIEDIKRINSTLDVLMNNPAYDKTTDYLGKKTLRTNNQSNVVLNSDNNLTTNNLNHDLNQFKYNKIEHTDSNLGLKENTDQKSNLNLPQDKNKPKINSELQKQDIGDPEMNVESNYNFPDTRKNSDLFNNKRFDDIFNLDCNFGIAEDMINFDCFSNGIFSNKEITFDENYNSHGEELDNIDPVDKKAIDYSDTKSIKDSVKKQVFSNGDNNTKITEVTNKMENENSTNVKLMDKNKLNEQTIEDSYKNMHEKPFYEKKNMNMLKKFFNQNTKNDNNTIKSIDDTTTVSTQFTKEKNSTKNSLKSQTHNLMEYKNSEIKTPIINNYPNNQITSICESKTPSKNLLLSINKNYRLDKHENYSNNTASGVKTFSVKSEGASNKCGNYNRIYLDNPNNLVNTNSLNVRSTYKTNQMNLMDKEKNEKSEMMSNVSLNLNCSNNSKEKNLNSFCIQNDFIKTFNNKKDSQSNEIYKNLLATAKYFDLDG